MFLEEAERRLKIPETFISHVLHIASFKLTRPQMQLKKAMLVFSIDIDAGSKSLGLVNNGKNDSNVCTHLSEYTVGKIEETMLPLFVNLFDRYDLPVTVAVRGQLFDVDGSALDPLFDSSVKHDIGAHGYSHREFGTLSVAEAENEIGMTATAMKKFNITPVSFIFPRNSVAHLSLLEQSGYKCYRSFGNFMHDRMRIEKNGNLYNIHPSLHLTRSHSHRLLERIIDVAVSKRAPLHIWFHLWNFGETKGSVERSINHFISPMLRYAKQKVDCDQLTFETMPSAAIRFERNFGAAD